jgi:hypothetical protein
MKKSDAITISVWNRVIATTLFQTLTRCSHEMITSSRSLLSMVSSQCSDEHYEDIILYTPPPPARYGRVVRVGTLSNEHDHDPRTDFTVAKVMFQSLTFIEGKIGPGLFRKSVPCFGGFLHLSSHDRRRALLWRIQKMPHLYSVLVSDIRGTEGSLNSGVRS